MRLCVIFAVGRYVVLRSVMVVVHEGAKSLRGRATPVPSPRPTNRIPTMITNIQP